jgi:hypothetical protein
MNTPLGLVKSFTAETAIAKRRIVSFGTQDGHVVQSTSDTGILGVSGIRGAEAGGPVDVYLSEMQGVECGANVNAGDYITADADGKAIPAAPAEGEQMQVVGRAMESGPLGAILTILIQPQQITG